jgi:hypothetical protein
MILRVLRSHIALVSLILAAFAGESVMSQPTLPKRIEAVRLDESIIVDGVLSESVWNRSGDTTFVQRSPRSGAKPSERTQVWVAYDNEALYVAARCFDRRPSQISRSIGRRDSDVESDWFRVSIDPYRDRRTGFYFQVNAGGSIEDGILYEDTRSDNSWDGVWDWNSSIDSLGWSVEIRIPFSQLRFSAEQEQIWGINFGRRIHRTNEIVDFITAQPYHAGNVSRFSELVGIRGIIPQSRFEVLPYVAGRAHSYEAEPNNPFYTGRDYGLAFGGEMKLGLGSSLTLTGTFNPDFGQVEVDPAVINLSAYETFYQEKRPFFLEGASIFDFGKGEGMKFFYSRRIGRPPQGQPSHKGFYDIPDETGILGAAKLSGKIGNTWSIGWLNAVTRREYARVDSSDVRFEDEVEPLTYYGVLRTQGEFNEGRQGLGFFSTGVFRNLREENLKRILNDNAVVAGIDGWTFFGPTRMWSLSGWAGVSHATGIPTQMIRLQRSSQRYFQRPDAPHLHVDSLATSLSGWAGQLVFKKQEGKLGMNVSIYAISPGFELNDLGYNSLSDRISGSVKLTYGWYQPDGVFNRKSIGVSASREYDYWGTPLVTSLSLFASGQFWTFWAASLSVSYQPGGIDIATTRGGPSMLAPAGWSGSVSVESDSRRSLLLSVTGEGSRDVRGNWAFSAGMTLSWRPSSWLMLSVGPWWGKTFSQTGYFTQRRDPLAVQTYGIRTVFADLLQTFFTCDLRLECTLSPKLSLQMYMQPYYSDVTYYRFKELARARSYDFNIYGEPPSTLSVIDGEYRIDPDGAGPARPFVLYDSNFKWVSLRGTAVLRWEYLRGSTLYLAWTHDRYNYEDFWQKPMGGNVYDVFSSYPDNRFMIKIAYWINP